jgi:hypothetical protein
VMTRDGTVRIFALTSAAENLAASTAVFDEDSPLPACRPPLARCIGRALAMRKSGCRSGLVSWLRFAARGRGAGGEGNLMLRWTMQANAIGIESGAHDQFLC